MDTAYDPQAQLGVRRPQQPRETKPADRAMGEAERLNSRLNATLSTLSDLRERVSGARPPSEGARGDAATAFALGGFVGNVGTALERAHTVLGEIDEVVQQIADVI
jgi:hypothetical protein